MPAIRREWEWKDQKVGGAGGCREAGVSFHRDPIKKKKKGLWEALTTTVIIRQCAQGKVQHWGHTEISSINHNSSVLPTVGKTSWSSLSSKRVWQKLSKSRILWSCFKGSPSTSNFKESRKTERLKTKQHKGCRVSTAECPKPQPNPKWRNPTWKMSKQPVVVERQARWRIWTRVWLLEHAGLILSPSLPLYFLTATVFFITPVLIWESWCVWPHPVEKEGSDMFMKMTPLWKMNLFSSLTCLFVLLTYELTHQVQKKWQLTLLAYKQLSVSMNISRCSDD